MDRDETNLYRKGRQPKERLEPTVDDLPRQQPSGGSDAVSFSQAAAQVSPPRGKVHERQPTGETPELAPKTPRPRDTPEGEALHALRNESCSRRAHIVYNALMHSSKAGGRKAKELSKHKLPGEPAIWREAFKREWIDWLDHDSVELEEHPEAVDLELVLPMRPLRADTNEKAREEDPSLGVLARTRIIVPWF